MHPFHVDPRPEFLLGEDPSAAGAAAKALQPGLVHLVDPAAGYVQYVARLLENVLVTPEVAGVVIGVVELVRIQRERSALQEPVDEDGVVLDLDLHPQVPVIAPERIEAVRAGGDDLRDAVPFDGLDVLLGAHLVEVLVAELSERLAAALLLLAEDADPDPRSVADLHEAPRHLLVSLVEGGVATDEVEDVHLRPLAHQAHLKPLGPVPPAGVGKTEGVAVHLDVVDGDHDLLARKLPLHEHQVTAHIDDLVDVLDLCRTDLLAGAAGGAGPEHVLADRLDQVRARVAEGDLAYLLDDLHGRERLTRVPGRAAVLAALAARAGVGVVDVLPGEIGDLVDPELLHPLLFQVDGGDRTLFPQVGEQVVGRRGEQVAELAPRDGDDETHDQEEVDPPPPLVQLPERGVVEPRELPRHQGADRREPGEPRVLDQLRGGDPRPLDEKAGAEDGGQKHMHQVIVGGNLQTFRPDHETPDGEAEEGQNGDHPRDVEHQGVELVEGPLENHHVEKRLRKVGLGHDQQGADEKQHEPPEEERVGDAGAGYPQHLQLPEEVPDQEADALPQPVHAVQRLPLPVHREPPVKTEAAGGHRQEREQVHGEHHPVADIPIDFPGSFHPISCLLLIWPYDSNSLEMTTRCTSLVPS